MHRRKLMLMLAMVVLAAGSAWCQSQRVERVPVLGEYVEPALGTTVFYDGLVYLTWTPPRPGTTQWTVAGTLVADAFCPGNGSRYTLYSTCQDCFDMASGDRLEVDRPFWAVCLGPGQGFTGVLRSSIALAREADHPVVQQLVFRGP